MQLARATLLGLFLAGGRRAYLPLAGVTYTPNLPVAHLAVTRSPANDNYGRMSRIGDFASSCATNREISISLSRFTRIGDVSDFRADGSLFRRRRRAADDDDDGFAISAPVESTANRRPQRRRPPPEREAALSRHNDASE